MTIIANNPTRGNNLQIAILDQAINMVNGLYSLNDLHRASGGDKKHQPAYFMRNQEVTDLIEEIKCSANLQNKQVFSKLQSGKNRGTYVCKELVYRYAMWISPKFALLVIRTFDNLVAVNSNITPITPADAPSTVKDRNGLVKAARITQYKLGIGYDDVFSLINHRFNVDKVGDLTASQVGEATEYIQRMRYPQIAERPHKSDNEPDALTTSDEANDPTEYGIPVTMVNQTMASGKFFGTIDSNGRMTMRELGLHEFITSLEALPIVIANNRFEGHVLANISVAVSHKLYRDIYDLRPSSFVADTQGVGYDR